jgi:N,N'-diacetyllegionaminate synthase
MNTLSSVMIIAEVGSVHDGSFGNAKQLITAAADCGVDAVKFQTHISDAETLPDAPMPPYFKGEPRFEYFNRTGFTLEQWQVLKDYCTHNGAVFLSSPFSEAAVDLLEQVGVEQYKIPSGEVTNLPLLEKIASLGKPIILSSGMSSWDELDRAVDLIRKYGAPLTILQCTSQYPCGYEQVGLNIMQEMMRRYQFPVGLSDHTLTNYAAFAAVSLGARVIEKHFTFSRLMYGSDAKHSVEPDELKDLVMGIRAIETMLASPVNKDDLTPYREMKQIFEKSLVSTINIPEGTRITAEMVTVKKPGTGMPASRLSEVLGKISSRDIPANTLLLEQDFIDLG